METELNFLFFPNLNKYYFWGAQASNCVTLTLPR